MASFTHLSLSVCHKNRDFSAFVTEQNGSGKTITRKEAKDPMGHSSMWCCREENMSPREKEGEIQFSNHFNGFHKIVL